MSQHDHPFEALLGQVYIFGEKRTDRTGTGTRSIFAPDPLRFDLSNGRIPLITSKAVPWKMALREFMWMLSGSTNIGQLAKSSPTMAGIWANWADDHGDIGPTYGAQYRNAGGSVIPEPPGTWLSWDGTHTQPKSGVDQLRDVVGRLHATPDTRRAIISLWSAPELDKMALEPCMVLFQFSLRGENLDQLDLHVYQRSADMMLGVPFDLFQAGFLAHAVARELTLLGQPVTARQLTWSAGDVHIYETQLEPVRLQLKQRKQAEPMRATIDIDDNPSLHLLNNSLAPEHVAVHNYNPEPAINGGKIAV